MPFGKTTLMKTNAVAGEQAGEVQGRQVIEGGGERLSARPISQIHRPRAASDDPRGGLLLLSMASPEAIDRTSGRLAQLVERHVYTVDVGSSSLSPPTTKSGLWTTWSGHGRHPADALIKAFLAHSQALRPPGAPC